MTPLLRTHRTWIEIDRRALLANLRYFARRAQGASMMVMIKSNAYGHGLVTIAKLLARQNLYLGVDSITEALRLRKENIQNPILVLGYTLPTRMREAAAKNIVVTISHFEGLASLAKLKKRPRFHVKIDTGMHRQGFQESQVPRLIAALKQYRLRPDGLYSHLAMASHSAFSRKQILAFERCLELFQKADLGPRLVHFNKTEGIVNFPQASHSLVRLGIGLYGYYPAPGVRLRPVLAWKTIVGEVKTIKKGERVSYDLTERVRRDTKIAILPVGYWHGFDRGLSSIGEVLIGGQRAKVLGRVTMDMTMVDVARIKNVRVGDEVVIIGKQAPLEARRRRRLPRFRRGPLTGQGREFISADEIAKKIGTTAYEVLTRINLLIYKIVV